MGSVTISIEAVKKLATFPIAAMLQELGPLALVQHESGDHAATLHLQLSRTVANEGRPPVARHALSLMMGLEHGLVVPLGRDSPEGELLFGREAEADVILDDPAVSARHAIVRWDGWKRTAWVRDLDSTNGTLVNGRAVVGEVELAEGNMVMLGNEAAFLFLRTETLYLLLHLK